LPRLVEADQPTAIGTTQCSAWSREYQEKIPRMGAAHVRDALQEGVCDPGGRLRCTRCTRGKKCSNMARPLRFSLQSNTILATLANLTSMLKAAAGPSRRGRFLGGAYTICVTSPDSSTRFGGGFPTRSLPRGAGARYSCSYSKNPLSTAFISLRDTGKKSVSLNVTLTACGERDERNETKASPCRRGGN
jgi:hypothetical protein